jgi:hypothetical protein
VTAQPKKSREIRRGRQGPHRVVNPMMMMMMMMIMAMMMMMMMMQ